MPAFASVNGLPVLRGTVSLPRAGAWTARLVLDSETAPSGPVTLATDEGAVTFRGSVIPGRSGPVFGRVEVLLVGGAGGLGASLPPRAYRSIPAGLVLEDLAREASETIAAASDSGLLGQQLPHWSRFGGPMSQGLDQLAEALGGAWRVNRAGELLVTARGATTASTSQGQLLDRAPAEGFAVYALEQLDLEPGQTFDGQEVAHVEHEISADRIRSRVWFA